MIVGYVQNPRDISGQTKIIYEINDHFYEKKDCYNGHFPGNVPAKKIDREYIDSLVKDGKYISEPKEIYLNKGMKAFVLGYGVVLRGEKEELVRTLVDLLPFLPLEKQKQIKRWINFQYSIDDRLWN